MLDTAESKDCEFVVLYTSFIGSGTRIVTFL